MLALIKVNATGSIAQALQERTDVKGISEYSSIPDFLQQARRQSKDFERVLIMSSAIKGEPELKALNSFLLQSSPNTEVVVVSPDLDKSNSDLLGIYYSYFVHPIYTDYVLEPNQSQSIALLVECFKSSIDSIREHHSSRKNYKPTVLMKGVSAEDEVKVEQTEISQPQGVIERQPLRAKSPLLKSFKHGGRFFGKKKLNKKELASVIALEKQANRVLQLGGGR